MVERVREALISSYAGAIMVGWTLAQGVTTVIGLVLSPVVNLAIQYHNQQQAGAYSHPETKVFDFIQLGVGAVKAVVIIAIGLMLLKWLYMPTTHPLIAENLTEDSE